MLLHKITCRIKKSKERLINIKNNGQKFFLWCQIRHINPVKTHPERNTREDEKLVNNLNYDGVEFSVREKDFSRIEKKNNTCVNVFFHENRLTFQSTFQIKNLKTRCIY